MKIIRNIKYRFVAPGNLFGLLIMVLSLFSTGCKKLVEVDAPVTSINSENVFENDATAAAVITGIYGNMSNDNILSGGLTSLSLFPSLSADELTLFDYANQDAALRGYYTNALTKTSLSPNDFWSKIYPIIFSSNAAIEGLASSKSLTEALKDRLIGEAKFIRAYCYFYLVNLYGDVPLVLTTNYKTNSFIARTNKNDVYQQIVRDLKDAQGILSTNFLKANLTTTTTERVRPTKWAATALLARVYLYLKDWQNAEAQSSAVIVNNSLFNLSSLSDVFIKNNSEAIWQLQPVTSTPLNTWEGFVFDLPADGPNTSNHPVFLSKNQLAAFEIGDQRRQTWISDVIVASPMSDTFYYPAKYKEGENSSAVVEYSTVLRLAEQYLIRAEARAQQSKLTEAQSDLNVIRNRAGLANTTASTQTALLDAILHERQVELFTEYGHRWLDLKRTSNVDAVMNLVISNKGGTWQSTDQLYPIPQYEIERNPLLVQNPGY